MERRTMVMKIIKEELNEQGEGVHVCNPALSRQNQKDHSKFKKFESLPGAMLVPRTPGKTPPTDLHHSSMAVQHSPTDPLPSSPYPAHNFMWTPKKVRIVKATCKIKELLGVSPCLFSNCTTEIL